MSCIPKLVDNGLIGVYLAPLNRSNPLELAGRTFDAVNETQLDNLTELTVPFTLSDRGAILRLTEKFTASSSER